MKMLNIAGLRHPASQIALGCMRISRLSAGEADRLIGTALESGINYFDHADIYGGGASEEIFSRTAACTPSVREKILIQSKCGIRRGMYDFSKDYILASVDGILKRLNLDYLDVLLLHRPDALMEPEEVAEAFDLLQSSGKVLNFGVSNENPYQIALLQKYVRQKLLFDQLQFSITNSSMIDRGLNVNMENSAAVDRDGGILDYCRLNEITIQPWSPFQYGFFEGVFLNHGKFPELNAKIDELAEKYGVANSAIAIAWILRHPARMQPIVGTTNAGRLKDICAGSGVTLTRQEWYAVYLAAGKKLP